jgi:hypothetical protein
MRYMAAAVWETLVVALGMIVNAIALLALVLLEIGRRR